MADRVERYARVAVAGLAVLVVLSVGVGAATSPASFSAYNSAWDGAAEMRSVAAETDTPFGVATELETAYRDPESTASVVLSPDRPYTRAEARQVRQFVEEGGTLVVADDFGPHANSLLAAVGADVRVDGRLLRDERRHGATPNFSEATTTPDATFLDAERTLTLNHGSALRAGNATVLARSSEYAYLDGDRNYELDDDETLESRPVVAREAVGEGTVIVVSDPSILINAMLDREGNRAFAAGLFGSRERVVADYSHAESVPPLVGLLLWLQRTPLAQVAVGAGGLALLGVGVRRPRRLLDAVGPDDSEPRPADPDALRAYLRARHPDWGDAELDRVMTGVITSGEHPSEDD